MEEKIQYVLAVDMGTQNVRAMLVDKNGNVPAIVKRQYDPPYYSESDGYAEQKADFYWNEICGVVRQLKEYKPLYFDDICAVTLTTIRDTFVCLDSENRPVRDVILWMDKRDAPGPEFSLLKKLLFRVTGMSDMITMQYRKSMCNWIMAKEPEIWKRTAKYATISAYITYKLTGKLCDSAASIIGHIPFDMKNHRWMKKTAIKRFVFPVDPDKLFDFVEPGELIGYISEKASEESGIPAGLPFYATGSDKGCETLGLSCMSSDKAAVSLGTAAAVQVTTDRFMEPFPLIPAYPAVIRGRFSPEFQLYSGYWLVSWFRDHFAYPEMELAGKTGDSVEKLLDRMLTQVDAGCDGLVFQPYFIPGVEMPKARGAYIGFSDRHTRAHMYRAIIEGIGLALKVGLRNIEKRGKFRVKEVFICGGGSASDDVCRITASIFNLPVHRITAPEAGGIGCAMVAFVSMGVFSDYDSAAESMVHIKDTFVPDGNDAALYEKIYREVFSKIFPRLLPFYKRYPDIF